MSYFSLNIGTEPEEIMALLSAALTAAAIVIGARYLPRKRKWLFVLAVFFLSLPSNLDIFLKRPESLTTLAVFDSWLRHSFFYLGEVFFFIFVARLYSSRLKTLEKSAEVVLGVVAALFLLLTIPTAVLASDVVNIFEIPLTPYNLLLFLTAQGLDHVLAIIFFFLTVAIVRSQSLRAGLEDVTKVNIWLFTANGMFIAIHFWEYLSESLHLFQLSGDQTEMVEFVFQYVGLIIFCLSVFKLRDLLRQRPTRRKSVSA